MTPAMANTSSSSDITTLHPDIFQFHILNRLDGPTLASAASATSHLGRLCTESHLWLNICTSTWPSLNDPLAAATIATFPATHRSIFSDSFPSLHHSPPNPIPKQRPTPPPELISAVDLYYKGNPVFSRVIRTETHNGWFLCSPLRVDVLDPTEVVLTTLKIEETSDENELLKHLVDNLALSWIIINPTRKRAANLSSRLPVSARRHWLTEELVVVYAVPMETVQCVVKVTFCGKVGSAVYVREVSLTMEDTKGRHVIGRHSVVILQDAMENGKREKLDAEEAKERFKKFSIVKRKFRERKMRKERVEEMVAMLVSLAVVALLGFIFVVFGVSPKRFRY